MATDSKSKQNKTIKTDKKRKQYLPHNRPVKKGKYALRPGLRGFFITCDGGKERQASDEAINVIESFFEDLVEGTEKTTKQAEIPTKPVNKVIKFTYSDSSSSDDDDENDDNEDSDKERHEDESNVQTKQNDANNKNLTEKESGNQTEDDISSVKRAEEDKEKTDEQEIEAVEPPAKKQCTENDASKNQNGLSNKVEKKSVDRLIEEELAELGDRSKRRFSNLDSGVNGVVFVQMRKRDGDPCPKDIVQHMMTSLAATRKHMSRFLLRVLPVEVTCYASDEEIRRAIKPVIEQFFPVETENPLKFAVLYDARANTGVDRKKIIDAVAKAVPSAHKVDLSNPDVSIVVQIVKAWIYKQFQTQRPPHNIEYKNGRPLAMRGKHERNFNPSLDSVKECREWIDLLAPNEVLCDSYCEFRDRFPRPGVAFCYRCIRSLDIVEPYYPDRVLRQFGYVQMIPKDTLPSETVRKRHTSTTLRNLFAMWDNHLLAESQRGIEANPEWECGDGYIDWYIQIHILLCKISTITLHIVAAGQLLEIL